MKRRGITVIVGALITAVLAVGVLTMPMPYVVLKPGPTVDTLGRDSGKEVIQISGTGTTTSKGQLRLTTVGVQPNVELVWAVRGWFDDQQAVVPREMVYPPDETDEQVEKRNEDLFKASQTSAETAALRELGYPVEVSVERVIPDGPSQGLLRAGDILTAVNGQKVTSATGLTDLIRAEPAGTRLVVSYTRAGTTGTADITTSARDGDPPRIGVEVEHKQPHPFSLEIELDEIGGPSAGLMFALGIIDKIRPADLTGGRVIAGTGTIDDDGKVGPIGGIPQKLVGAKGAGATVFLTPADNCAEAVRNAVPGLALVKVATLDEALAALETLNAGGRPAPCPAS